MSDFIGITMSTVCVLVIVLAPIALKRKIQSARAREWAAEQAVPFGEEVATAIAELLQRGLIVAYRHRDWCGMGLRYAEGVFVYGAVNDGELLMSSEAAHLNLTGQDRKEFRDTASFVQWLSLQTGQSLGVKVPCDQHLTRRRLIDAIEFCSKHEPARWPNYAG